MQGERSLSIHNIYNPCHWQNDQQFARGPFTGIRIDSALPHLAEALSKRKDGENIVLGAFNHWHWKWFGSTSASSKEERRLRKRVAKMQEHDLQLCIPPGTVTRSTNNSRISKGPTLNLLWSSELVCDVMECGVSVKHECDSDHLPIPIKAGCKKHFSKNTSSRKLLKNMDTDLDLWERLEGGNTASPWKIKK